MREFIEALKELTLYDIVGGAVALVFVVLIVLAITLFTL